MDGPRVLFVDDNPEHLKIYALIMEQGGHPTITCLARPVGIQLPDAETIRLAILDYTLNCAVPTAEIARRVRSTYPGAAILLLSDILGMPIEMEGLVDAFVRKGDPRRLLAAVADLMARQTSSPEPAPRDIS